MVITKSTVNSCVSGFFGGHHIIMVIPWYYHGIFIMVKNHGNTKSTFFIFFLKIISSDLSRISLKDSFTVVLPWFYRGSIMVVPCHTIYMYYHSTLRPAHTQGIERCWKSWKEYVRKMRCVREDSLSTYLYHWLFEFNRNQTGVPRNQIIDDILDCFV